MSKTEDNIIGKTFNRLTVLEKTKKKSGTTYLYLCSCACGTKEPVYAKGYSLKVGEKTSCGCLHKEQCAALGRSKSRYTKGQILDTWKLVEDTGKRDSDGRVIWLCQCLKCKGYREISSHSMQKHNKLPMCECSFTHGSHGERKIIDILKSNNIQYITEFTFEDLKLNGKKLRFDFYLPEYSVLIEYDGRQHYIDENNWGAVNGLESIKERDNIKNKYCIKNNLTLIRIPYYHFDKLKLSDLLPETSDFIVKEENA